MRSLTTNVGWFYNADFKAHEMQERHDLKQH